MRHQQHRALVETGEVAQQVDHLATGGGVERGGGLVGEEDRGTSDQGARDRHALALSARELARERAGAVAEADRSERFLRSGAGFGRLAGEQRGGQHHVLERRQRAQQVMALEDEADATAHGDRLVRANATKLDVEHAQAPILDPSQGGDQGQQRGLARPRRAGEEHDLAAVNREVEVGEDAAAVGSLAEPVGKPARRDDGAVLCGRHRHQNTSAGSAAASLRIASAPATAHMAMVSASTATARPMVRSAGKRAISRIRW